MLRRLLLNLLLSLLLCPAYALAGPLTISDDLGRELTLKHPAARVVVLGDFCAEMVTALKATNLLVGRARWVSWPPQVAKLPHLGLQTQPNLEVLISWQPDLILADAHLRQALPLLEKLNLPVMVYQGRDLAAIRHALNSLSLALDRREQGEKLLAFVDEIASLLNERLDAVAARPMLLSFSEHGPPYYDILATRPLLALARLQNIIPSQGSVNPEWLLFHPPDLAVLALWRPHGVEEQLQASYHSLLKRPELANINELYVMDSRLVYNLQAFAGLLYLAKLRHPEAFAGVRPEDYHARLWRDFFGLELPAPMVYPHD